MTTAGTRVPTRQESTMYRCELWITEDEAGRRVRVLAPSEPEDLAVSAESLAAQHLRAELQGRWVRSGQLPHRVEVLVWDGEAEGPPDATAAWEHGPGYTSGPGGRRPSGAG
jgi:hypothetical protein